MMRLEIKIMDRDTNVIEVVMNCDDKGDAMGLAHQLANVARDFNRALKLSGVAGPVFMSEAEIAKRMRDAQAQVQVHQQSCDAQLDVRHPRDPQSYHTGKAPS